METLLKPAEGQEFKDLLVTGEPVDGTGGGAAAAGTDEPANHPPIRYYFSS